MATLEPSKPQTKTPRLGTAVDVGRLLGVCAATIRQREREGKLKAAFRTPGGTRLFDLDEIAARAS